MFICDGDGRSVKNAAFSIYIYGDIKLRKTSLRIWCVLQPADFEFSRLESWSRDSFLQVLVSVLNLWVLADWADLTHHLIQLSRRGFKTCLFKTKTKTKTKTCLSKTKTKTLRFQLPKPRLLGSRPRPRPRLVKTSLETKTRVSRTRSLQVVVHIKSAN